MSKVLVLGSNSFSGASFVAHLLIEGYDVIGASRSEEAAYEFLPYKWAGISGERFRFTRLDINDDLDKLIGLIKSDRIGHVVNFSAQSMVGESWDTPADWYRTNSMGTAALIAELSKLDFLDKYVHIGTPEVYGNCEGFIKEDEQLNPSTPYAVSRATADMTLKIYGEHFDLPYVTTRAANVYGEGQQLYRIIPRTILSACLGSPMQLHGGGKSTRSFIHIDDVSVATSKIMSSGPAGEVFHISTNEIISIKDLVSMIFDMVGRARFEDCVEVVGDRVGKDAAYLLDSEKLRRGLQWRDQIGLAEGVERTVKWVTDNLPVLQTVDPVYRHKR